MPGEIAFPDLSTGTAFLKSQAEFLSVKDMTRCDELIKRLQLDPRANLKRMSKGMKQKTAIVAAFMSSPDIYLLDEPTTGLDPLMRDSFLDIVREEQKKGKTVLMSSHMFEDLEPLCDRVALISDGKIVDIADMKKIRKPETREYKIEFFKKTEVDALAISYGTMHGASKGKDVKLRREIAVAIRECMNHLGIFGALVSHGSSTVPKYIVDEINGLGGRLSDTYGISIDELKAAIPCGISKINVDTDIRLAVTRNMKELFAKYPEKRTSSSIGPVYELLETKKNQFDPRVFLPPIMDTVMYGTVPDEDVAAIVDCVERGVKEVVGTLIVQFGSFGKAPLIEQVSLEEMAERYKK